LIATERRLGYKKNYRVSVGRLPSWANNQLIKPLLLLLLLLLLPLQIVAVMAV
jgi:hypothetical protein